MKKITKNTVGWLVMAAALTVGMVSCSSEDELDKGSVVDDPEEELPEGALPGKFSIGGGGSYVYFSKGNLRANYNNNSWTWSFSPNQWDYVGNASNNINITGDGTVDSGGDNLYVDLFGWSTKKTYYGIHNSKDKFTYFYLFKDWGNVDGIGKGWRTLTRDEWEFLLRDRFKCGTVFGTPEAHYTYATIRTDVNGGVNGIILFPDDISISASEVTTAGPVNDGSGDYETKCTSAQWTALEAKGCVFLPAAGCRIGNTVVDDGECGYYWSSSMVMDGLFASTAYCTILDIRNPDIRFTDLYYGCSVRLVHEAP